MFDWDEFFALAERLDMEGADEATQRTIISRAYYAAYHAASAFVRAKGLLRVSHSHATVWSTLMAQKNADRTNVGLRGNWLRQARARGLSESVPGRHRATGSRSFGRSARNHRGA